MRLLLSIHDATPAWARETRWLWDACVARGALPALLVVPTWHGDWPLEAHADYVRWLRACRHAGADLLLHGLRHDEHGIPRGAGDALRALGRTDREGEFLTLERRAAARRIAEGVARLRALELPPLGFVPPAWLMRPATRLAVADAGLALVEDAGAVYLFDRPTSARAPGRPHLGRRAGAGPRDAAPAGRPDDVACLDGTGRPDAPRVERLRAPALRWSARSAWRARASACVARLRLAAWRTPVAPALLRIALHPGDVTHAVTRASVLRTLDALLRGGAAPLRYAQLVGDDGPASLSW